jgi:hypothetical protein
MGATNEGRGCVSKEGGGKGGGTKRGAKECDAMFGFGGSAIEQREGLLQVGMLGEGEDRGGVGRRGRQNFCFVGI